MSRLFRKDLVAKLKSANATTVVCGCDPVLLLFMTGKAREQNYFPEWVLTGVAFTDQDIVGQLFDQAQWVNSVGVSFAGDVLTTPPGWAMISIGIGVGFLFAIAALLISVISFPLLIDRDVGASLCPLDLDSTLAAER